MTSRYLVVYTGAMNTKQYAPTPQAPQEVRLTIPVSKRVHDIFTRIAKAGNVPVGRSMGEWLADTVEAAEFMAAKMEEARLAPTMVAREMHSYALGLSDMTQELIDTARNVERAGMPLAPGLPPFGVVTKAPPSSNTGGKVSPLATKVSKPTRKTK